MNTATQIPLTSAQLPSSVFADRGYAGVSTKYAHLSTIQIVNALAERGVLPYLAKSSGTRIEEKRGYTKHLLRFRAEGASPLVGGVYPEIVLTNSHDTGSSFRVDMGLFRLVCQNGLVVSYGAMSKYRIRHVGSTMSDVLGAVDSVMQNFPLLGETVLTMQSLGLSDTQRYAFAQAAMALRYELDKFPYSPQMLLSTRRSEDAGTSLWNVYNTVQENLLRGQRLSQWGRFHRTERSTRQVKSIDVEMSLNQGLWSLAEGMIATA